MKSARYNLLKCLGTLSLVVAFMPAISLAQQQGAAGRGGMMAMPQMPQQLLQILKQVDLTPDQTTKIQGIVKKAQTDIRDLMQGIQDATPEERQQKNQDRLKIMTDTKTQVEAELTPEQKAKYFPAVASASLKYIGEFMTALKTASTQLEIADEPKKQLSSIFDDSQKSLDALKPDALTVKDADTTDAFQKSISKVQMETSKQVLDLLGQEDARKLMQAARQSMVRNALGGGRAGRRGANDTTPADAPTTKPAAK